MIASVTLLSDWICGGQMSLDDLFELIYDHILTYQSNLFDILNMGVISGMATMAMAIPTISFGHRSGHFWP